MDAVLMGCEIQIGEGRCLEVGGVRVVVNTDFPQ